MFEMITPSHVIVVRPDSDEIYLHGARDLVTLEEVQPGPIAEEVCQVQSLIAYFF